MHSHVALSTCRALQVCALLFMLVCAQVAHAGEGGEGAWGTMKRGQDTAEAGGGADTPTAFIERFYVNILGRPSDQAGLNGWLEIIQAQSASAVALGFFNSTEFLSKDLDNRAFLDILYSTLFNRAGDSGGVAGWLELLEAGKLRDMVIYGFLRSAEFKALSDSFSVTAVSAADEAAYGVRAFTERFYTLVLSRQPDVGGFNTWVSGLSAGTLSGSDIAKAFFLSAEYLGRNTSDSDFVDTCYQAFFGRAADAAGKQGWLAVLSGGQNREAVLNGFSGSAEFAILASTFGITDYPEVATPVDPEPEVATPIDPEPEVPAPTDPEYNSGEIIDVTGDGSDFFKREVTVNGVRIMAAGAVGEQLAVPDAWLEKVGRVFELFTDPNGAGINESFQREVIKNLSGDAGTWHAGLPTIQRVARGAGADYTPNFLTDSGITYWNLTNLFDTHVQNDMVWYLNSTGDGYGNGDNDAQEVIEHVFHTLHMHGLDARTLKMYSYLASDWASGPLCAAMEEAYDGGFWDPSGYEASPGAFKTDPGAFEVAAKEYLFLLNFSMFDYTSLWEGGSLAPEWSDTVRTEAGILANNPLGYALHNTYIAPVISQPSLATIRSLFPDGDVPK